VPDCATPAESRAWAEATAREIRRTSGDAPNYRPLNPMTLWGLAWPARRSTSERRLGEGAAARRPIRTLRCSRTRIATDAAARATRPDGGEQSAGADAATDESDAHGIATDGGPAPSERARSAHDVEQDCADRAARRAAGRAAASAPRRHPLPEWDEYAQRLRPHGATVTRSVADEGDAAWADDVLREHAPIVREIRDRFAPARAQRTRLRAAALRRRARSRGVRDGARRPSHGTRPSEQLYQVVRPARHTVAFALLVDTSGSTNTKLADGRTVLDVERMTLLLASEALASLGDPYAMLAFSGAGRHGVRVRTIKGSRARCRRGAAPDRRARAAGQHPARRRAAPRDGGAERAAGAATRAPAAVGRTAERRRALSGPVRHRGLARALHEARAEGVVTFCLTVEQEEREYLPHLFGTTGYRVLSRPAQLPEACWAS
jgi:nitric oxide reductase NorD protein